MLLGIFVGSQAADGQIPAPRILPEQKPVAPVITVFSAESKTLLPPSLLLSQDRENTFAHTSLRYPEPYERDDVLERLSPVIKLKTLILTHAGEPAARPTLGRKARTEGLSEYAAHSERAVWRFRQWRHAGLSSSET